MSRVRGFTFTYFPTHQEELDTLRFAYDETMQYVGWGREVCPDTGKIHAQGVVYFHNTHTLTAARFFMNSRLKKNCHIEVVRNWEQALAYCKKDGHFEQYGKEPKKSTAEATLATAQLWSETRRQATQGAFASINDRLYIVYHRNLRHIHEQDSPLFAENGTRALYIEGATGIGKTFAVRTLWPDAYFKPAQHKWWDGYAGQEVVVINDLDENSYMAAMKEWLDVYPFRVETKGGSMIVRPRLLVVTSQYRWENLLPPTAQLLIDALNRRCDFVTAVLPYGKFLLDFFGEVKASAWQ